MWAQIFGPLIDLAGDVFTGWRDDRRQQREAETQIATAELARDVAVIQSQAAAVARGENNEHEWNMEAARQARTSWKDEWFTVLLSVPLVLAFIPGAAPLVESGFAAISQTPEWYRLYLGAAVAFAFGVRHLIPLVQPRR